jgi:CYTH domain-containing protein
MDDKNPLLMMVADELTFLLGEPEGLLFSRDELSGQQQAAIVDEVFSLATRIKNLNRWLKREITDTEYYNLCK